MLCGAHILHSVDPKLREAFWQHFKGLAASGVTVVLSTHLMDDAMHCDQLGIVHQGLLLAHDTPRELLWENRASVKLWRGGEAETHELENYPQALPTLLHKEGLNPAIERIEVQEETLEQVVLRLVYASDGTELKERQDD